jgi:hypothetical protein
MKKALLGTFVTLLVMLALVSCDDVIGGLGGEKVEYDQNGNRLVEVSIINKIDRSITDDFAKEAENSNYMEVIFSKGGSYYQASGLRALPLKIKIPVGDYAIGEAILLLGRNSDKTLVATGVLTGNPSAPAFPFNVTALTTSISFTVTSIETDIRASASPLSFKINEGTGTPNLINSVTSGFGGKTNGGKFGGVTCFQLPLSTGNIGASLEFSGLSASGSNIIMAAGSTIKFTEIGTSPAITTITTVTPGSGALGTTGEIGFTFGTTTAGQYIIFFEIKVVGFATGIPDATTWNLRGGTTRNKEDLDATDPTKGEGLVLIVTSDPNEPVEVVINP